jgi:hypothetical protein
MIKHSVGAWAMGVVLAVAACSGGGGGSSSGDGGTSSGGGTGSSSGGTSSSSSGGVQKKAQGQGPCEAASECQGDVCVSIIDGDNPPVYCTQECTSGACPSGFRCDSTTFQLVGRTFCRFGETPPAGGMEETPSEPPTLPCKTDADCDDTEVCGTWMAESQCTLRCTAESNCDLPAVGGIRIDLLTCSADEGAGTNRNICVPDAACFSNPLQCTDFGG